MLWLKARNEQRLEEYLREGRIRAVFSSQVLRIQKDAVLLKVTEKAGGGKKPGNHGPERKVLVPCEFTLVFAGGEPPYPLLKEMGISFGVEEKDPDREERVPPRSG